MKARTVKILQVLPGDSDRLTACGLEFRDQSEWETTCQRLAAAGYELSAGTAEQAERRCVSGFASVTDPSGNLLELFYGRRLDYKPLNSPAGIKNFVTGDEYTGDMGFGHAVLPAPETEATHSYYTGIIGNIIMFVVGFMASQLFTRQTTPQ